MHRLVHIGLGPLGLRVAADFVARGSGVLVAGVDGAPEIAGRPLAEIVPGAGPDPVLASVEELELGAAGAGQRIDAALVTTRSDLEACADTFRALLAGGLTVVSSCEELLYPWLRHPVLAQELHERAVRGGGRLLGTGVNPGFVMDALPLMLSGAGRSLRSVKVERIQDASSRRLPFQKKIGAGMDRATFERAAEAGSVRHVGLGESLHFLAHYLGVELERWEETLEPVIAEEGRSSGLGPIPAGDAAGVKQVARGFRSGADEPVIELVFVAAVGQADPHDRIRIDGDPPLDLLLQGGVHGDVATSAALINAVDALAEAAPGLHTMATLRPPRGVFRLP